MEMQQGIGSLSTSSYITPPTTRKSLVATNTSRREDHHYPQIGEGSSASKKRSPLTVVYPVKTVKTSCKNKTQLQNIQNNFNNNRL